MGQVQQSQRGGKKSSTDLALRKKTKLLRPTSRGGDRRYVYFTGKQSTLKGSLSSLRERQSQGHSGCPPSGKDEFGSTSYRREAIWESEEDS